MSAEQNPGGNPFILPPGYVDQPRQSFIDLSRWKGGTVAAGRGPVSGPPKQSLAQMCSYMFANSVYELIPLDEFTQPSKRENMYPIG